MSDRYGIANRILKVNHAGEHGAVNIYQAQQLIARFTAPDLLQELNEFLQHERQHRRLFANELARRGVRRCLSYHLCGLGGFVLGLSSALLGRAAIAGLSVAVERVVLSHLQQQLQQLADLDTAAYETVKAIIVDEQAHHDSAAIKLDLARPAIRAYTALISLITESVIFLGMHLPLRWPRS